jgi:ligand-binding sensor domain-containing protein/signal transduction histidine kinase
MPPNIHFKNKALQFYRFIWIIVFILATHHGSFGQSHYFRHYQVENGLSNNAVICSLQDRMGFLWFGTKDGLNRFDGYSFKVFRSQANKPGSVGSNFIHALYEDEKGLLWIGTEKGLYRYNPLSENFLAVEATANMPISEITSDRKGNIWFLSGLTLLKFNQAADSLTSFDPAQHFEATGICVTGDGTFWASTSNGFLMKYDPQTNTFSGYDLFLDRKNSVYKWIEKIYATDNGYILVGTGNAGAKIFDTKQSGYKNISINNNRQSDLFVRNFIQTSPGEFWMGTEAGVFIYNMATGNSVNLTKKYNDPFSISDNAVYTFCQDREGGIWVGTYFGGLNYYPKQYTPFKKFIPKTGENAIAGNVVREIKEDGLGNLWIGTEDAGLNKYNKATGRFMHFQPTGAEGSISYSNIHGLLVAGNELWIGTFEHGLDVMNITTGKVEKHFMSSPGSPLKSNFIYTVYQSPEGEIMIGTTIGAYRYNRRKNNFDTIPGMPIYNWYTSILKDANGVIWTGTYGNGINYYNTKSGERGNYRYNASKAESLSSDRVNSIFQDSDQNLWFATEDGLCRLVNAKGSFVRYGTANGFPSNFIISILEDANKNLWISTTKGLVNFNPATGKVQVYSSSNGLLSDQLNFSSAYKDSEGRMYFGSAKGLVSFHPGEFSPNKFIPPVYITGFQINNQDIVASGEGPLAKNSITYTDKIILDHNESTFSIDFAALSFTAPETLEYAYRLEGLSKDWTHIKGNRKVYFTGLAPGTYTFRVKAANTTGVWSEKETKITIVIRPPWWASIWAYIAYALIVLLIIFYFIRNYHNRVEQMNRRKIELLQIAKEKEIFQAKIEFFTNVAHEIKTPLTLIKIPLAKVIKKTAGIPDIEASLRIMDRNTNRLIDLTNQLLDFRQTEINGYKLSFVNTNISELLADAYQSFSSLAEQRNIKMSIHLPPAPFYAYVDTEAFSKIIYNLFSNAVKYAEGNVQIYLHPFLKSNSSFTIQIKNDGYIVPGHLKEKIFEPFFRIKETAHQKGTGIGLALSLSLAQLHKGVLLLEDTEDGMNVFSLTLPVHQDVEFNLAGTIKNTQTFTPSI